MNKIKTLQILSGLLLLINIGLILFMVLKKGPRMRHKEGLEKHMQKVFEFNDDQMNKFIEYRDLHRERGEEISKQLLAASKSYYILDENKESKALLLDSIMSLSKEVYLNNEKHFNDLRSLCNSDQSSKINEFIESLIGMGKMPHDKKRRKRDK